MQRVLVLLAAFIVSVWLSWRIGISLAVPLVEARELATISAGLAIKSGSFGQIPDNVYFYGPLQPFLISLMPGSWDLVFINRLASILFIIASGVVLALAIKRWLIWKGRQVSRGSLLLSFFGYLYPFFIEPEGLATPAFIGVLVTNIMLFLSLCYFRGKYVLLALLLVLASQTKPYFILSGIYILASLLFVDSRKHMLSNFLIVAVSSLLFFLPFMYQEQTWMSVIHCATTSDCNSLATGLRKIFYYVLMEAPQICIICAAIILLLYKIVKSIFKNKEREHKRNRTIFIKKISGKQFAPDAYVILTTLLNILILIRLGGHRGLLGCLYHPQLASASIVLLLNLFLTDPSLNQKRLLESYALALCILVPMWEFHFWKSTPLRAFEDDLEKVVLSDIQAMSKIKHSAFTGIYELSQTGTISDNGQLQYIHTLVPSSTICNSSILKKAEKEASAYTNNLIRSIKQKKWDVIYTDDCSFIPKSYGPNYICLVSCKEHLEENYRCVGRFRAPILRQNNFYVSRWIKK